MTANSPLTADDKTRHSVFNLNYKMIIRTLHEQAIDQQVSYLIKQSAKRLSLKYSVQLTGWKWHSDYVAMRIHCYDIQKVHQFVEKFKQISSSDYHHIMNPQQKTSIWRPGFCLITVSSHSKRTVNSYLSK